MRIAKVKLNCEQANMLLNEKTVTVNLPAGCERLEVSAPLVNTAERLLREADLKRSESMRAFTDALLKGL